jgi:hypothetical protein
MLHGYPPKPAEEYLGPSLLPHLHERLKHKYGHDSWEEAVTFEVKKIISSGEAP